MPRKSTRHEFKVVFDGIELEPEVVDRVNRAVQKAVLAELATVDLHGELAVTQLAQVGNGGTNGIWAHAVSSAQAQQAGIEPPAEFRGRTRP